MYLWKRAGDPGSTQEHGEHGWFTVSTAPAASFGDIGHFTPTATDKQMAGAMALLASRGVTNEDVQKNLEQMYANGAAKGQDSHEWYAAEHDATMVWVDHGYSDIQAAGMLAATTANVSWSKTFANDTPNFAAGTTIYSNLTAAATCAGYVTDNPTLTITQEQADLINNAGAKGATSPTYGGQPMDENSNPPFAPLQAGQIQAQQLSDYQLGKWASMSGNSMIPGVPIGYPDSVMRGVMIARGADPTDVLQGYKEQSFMNNVAFPDEITTATIDSHMSQGMLPMGGVTLQGDDAKNWDGQGFPIVQQFDANGDPRTDKGGNNVYKDYARDFVGTPAGYTYCANMVIAAATAAGMVPNQYQAVAWAGVVTDEKSLKNSKLDIAKSFVGAPFINDDVYTDDEIAQFDADMNACGPFDTKFIEAHTVTSLNFKTPGSDDAVSAFADIAPMSGKLDIPTWFKGFGDPGSTQGRAPNGTFSQAQVVSAVQASLTDDLRRAPFKGNPNPMAGHCYVASEACYHMLGGKAAGYTPQQMDVNGVSHWFLKGPDGVVDPTASQFDTTPNYDQATGKGFLTSDPSARADTVIDSATALLNSATKGFGDPGSTQSRQPNGQFSAGQGGALDPAALEQKAIAHFGAAEELQGQQFVTPNGTILNLEGDGHDRIQEVVGGNVATATSRALDAGFLRTSLDTVKGGDLGLVMELTTPMTPQQIDAVRSGIANAGGIGYIAIDVANTGGYNRVTGAGGGLVYSQDQENPTSSQVAGMIRDANVAAGGSIHLYVLADLIKRFGDPGSTQQQDPHGRFTVGSGAPRDAANLKYPELHARDMSAGGTNSPLMTRAEFQASAARGEDIVNEAIANSSPPINLMTGANIQAAVDAAQQEWGGVTIDAHGGGVVTQQSQPPDPVSVSMRDAGQGSVVISAAMGASDPGTLMAAMQQAQTQFADQLSAQGAALGVFKDETSGTIQFDPVLVVQGVASARDVGAYTGATGGAYRFSDGNGYWPGHVA